MSNIILNIKNLFKTYNEKKALNHVNIKIKKGSIYGLIGQNGAGKTTLIRILNKIINADDGFVFFNEKELNNNDVKQIGYLPEERGLYKNMTIEEQALYLGQLKGMSKKNAATELNYWLSKFDIIDWKKKKIENLSKGMAQKVQFIITVLHKPDLIILDEPFSGLDPVNAEIIAKEIKELANKGRTIIFSSHRMESVANMCDELSLIHKGNILLQGNIGDIQQKYSKEIYDVIIDEVDLNILEVKQKSTLFSIKIKSIENNKTSIEIYNSKIEINEVLKELIQVGNVISFKQHKPTLQEIFIKTIANA